MEKKIYTVTMTNNETGDVKTFDFDGFILTGLLGKEDDGYNIMQMIQNLTGEEALTLIDDLTERKDIRAIRMARLFESLVGDKKECNCPKCTKKREEAGEEVSAEGVH